MICSGKGLKKFNSRCTLLKHQKKFNSRCTLLKHHRYLRPIIQPSDSTRKRPQDQRELSGMGCEKFVSAHIRLCGSVGHIDLAAEFVCAPTAQPTLNVM